MRSLSLALVPAMSAMALALAGCGGASVPSLAPSSPPEVVVATYLAAVQADDDDAARALSTAEHAESGAGLQGAGVSITGLAVEPAEERAVDEDGSTGSSLAAGHDEAVDVRTTFDVTGGDASLPDGSATWTFLLVRDGAGPWLVADEGTG